MTFNILKDVAKLCGQLDWNTKLSELDEQAILYLVMTIQQMKDVGDDVDETYLAAIWLKYNVGDKSAEFPFGKNKEQNSTAN
jgi:hypothetical protein|tara:strand:+ start:962 stop:1207 length:246 start_codon:yes stop_codon:yes gene_type:complete